MTELLTSAQMRAIEKAAIDGGAVTGLDLMERAGRGVVAAIFEEWPELQATSHRAVVLCGPGNNGGDGFVVARLLREWGWTVEAFFHGDPDSLPPDARVNYDRWTKMGDVQPFPAKRPDAWSSELVVDAGFGTGLTRPLDDDLIAAFLATLPEGDLKEADEPPYVVAVDIPTGLSSDSGTLLPASVGADLTVTFHSAKIGHYLDKGPEFSGKLKTVSIGLNDGRRHASGSVKLIEARDVAVSKFSDHKYAHGHALVLTGGPGKTGAARLAARGALRIGAGLVTLGCPRHALSEVAHHVTAIMTRILDGPPGLREVLEDDRLNALCLGPGLGVGADTQALVIETLKSGRATVLDADALTRFERFPDTLFGLLHDGCVLTPHAGEFKRLFPDLAAKLNAPDTGGPAFSKVDATREAAKRAGCTVLFKGPDTVIADRSGRCSINSSAYDRAAPWLATAGSGDVLAGFITGLLARGVPPMQAAETAAWLHTECALSFGPGLISEDLPEELPKVLARAF